MTKTPTNAKHADKVTLFVIRAQTRREKAVVASLAELGISGYCPLETRLATHARRTRRETYALFPGYLFADFTPDDFYPVGLIEGVMEIIGKMRSTPTIDPLQIDALRAAEAAGAFDRTITHQTPEKTFLPGQIARVIDGPYAGWIGKVAVSKGKNRVGLLIELFGRFRTVDLPKAVLEAA